MIETYSSSFLLPSILHFMIHILIIELVVEGVCKHWIVYQSNVFKLQGDNHFIPEVGLFYEHII